MPGAMQNDPCYSDVERGELGALIGENCSEAIGNPPLVFLVLKEVCAKVCCLEDTGE